MAAMPVDGADGGLGAFHGGQALLEAGDGGVGRAAVGVALLRVREALRRGLGVGLHEAAGEVQRLGVLAPLAGRQAGAHGERVAVQPGRQGLAFMGQASCGLGSARRELFSSSGSSWPMRASLMRAMSSGLMSPVTYTPSKQDASKPSSLRVQRADGALHAVDVLVDQRVAADDLAHLVDRAAMGHQFARRRHVDAVHVGEAHRRRGAGHVDLAGAGVARHLHDLAAGGAAHDGVVHQQHVAALELAGDHVQLLAHDFLRTPCPGMMKVRPT
jgi:hypothetical protein